jgi:hypothetical protein
MATGRRVSSVRTDVTAPLRTLTLGPCELVWRKSPIGKPKAVTSSSSTGARSAMVRALIPLLEF